MVAGYSDRHNRPRSGVSFGCESMPLFFGWIQMRYSVWSSGDTPEGFLDFIEGHHAVGEMAWGLKLVSHHALDILVQRFLEMQDTDVSLWIGLSEVPF